MISVDRWAILLDGIRQLFMVYEICWQPTLFITFNQRSGMSWKFRLVSLQFRGLLNHIMTVVIATVIDVIIEKNTCN